MFGKPGLGSRAGQSAPGLRLLIGRWLGDSQCPAGTPVCSALHCRGDAPWVALKPREKALRFRYPSNSARFESDISEFCKYLPANSIRVSSSNCWKPLLFLAKARCKALGCTPINSAQLSRLHRLEPILRCI